MSSLFQKVKKFSRLAALQGSASSRALVRCWRAGLPSPTGRGGTERGTDTAGAGGLLLHLGLLGLFCCFAVLHPGLLLNFGGVSLFCILF